MPNDNTEDFEPCGDESTNKFVAKTSGIEGVVPLPLKSKQLKKYCNSKAMNLEL